ncbi:MAG TPA: thermonuclease family protein [Thermoanaerobaculia bacterium]|jgi:endonuclease YncB( thermonuclease family)|nr:thermonuclease family protein [Thermoanaerobaculia bacterium]
MKRVLALALLLTAVSLSAQELRGRVDQVYDGDTLYVRYAGRRGGDVVRVEGIDAPERHQAYGARSRESLRELVKYKQVTLIVRGHDQYGRLIALVLLDDLDVGLEQIRRGMAWHYDFFAEEQSPSARESYRDAEAEAAREERGLWTDENPTPPWAYRRARR